MRNVGKMRMRLDQKSLLFFIGMLVVGGIGVLVYSARTGNTPQVYHDVVSEFTAEKGSNKSAERAMYYIFSIAGVLIYSLFSLKNRTVDRIRRSARPAERNQMAMMMLTSLVVFSLVYFFVYTGINRLVMAGLTAALILYLTDEELVMPGTSFLFINAYALCAVFRIYAFFGGRHSLDMMTMALFAIVVTLLLLAIGGSKKKEVFLRGILLIQLIVPFVLLLFLASSYHYKDEYITIEVPQKVKTLIAVLIAVFVAEALWKLFRCWKRPLNTGNVLTHGVCISIITFNQYCDRGAILSTDLHHPYEDIIAYYEIFEKGMTAFKDFIPVSGMYSVVQGALFYWLGDGQANCLALTSNIFYMFVFIIIVVLLKAQLKGEWVLLISLLFSMTKYNRVVLILPVMLLLCWPKLIEKKNLWLQAWMLTSFLHGLYYPILGAAVCAGFIPMGIWQIWTYASSGKLRKDLKRPFFWIGWILCMIPVGWGIPLLKSMFDHTMAMGSQTVYADGLTRFGQTIPVVFFSYLQFLSTRLVMYDLFSYLIVISIVWMSVALFFKAGRVYRKGLKIRVGKPVPACIALSIGISFLVAFSYTVIRMDVDQLYSRNEGLVVASFVLIILIVARYLNHQENRYVILGFAVFLLAASSLGGILTLDYCEKQGGSYTVSDEYVYVKKDPVKKLENSFVEKTTYETIEKAWEDTSDLDKSRTYLGVLSDFGLYQLCDLKGGAEIELAATIKGYDAAQEAADMVRKNETVIGTNLLPVRNYYMYYWLLTSGDYVWDSEKQVFFPADKSLSKEEILAKNKQSEVHYEGYSGGRTAGSWGSSIDTLIDLFTEDQTKKNVSKKKKSIQIRFAEPVDGSDADFIYLSFKGVDKNYKYTLFNIPQNFALEEEERKGITNLLKKDYNSDYTVVFTWKDDAGESHTMNCGLERGQLLVPLGCGSKWLMNDHTELKIQLIHGEEFATMPELTECKMLKLREIQ